MAEQHLILFYERYPLEERFGDPEDHLHGALMVEPPKAKEVASDICVVLNRDVSFKRNAAPHFACRPAASPPDPLWAQFDVEIKGYAGHPGFADGDEHCRAVAYHQKARQLEASVRERKGLATAPPPKQPSKNDDDTRTRETGEGTEGPACWFLANRYYEYALETDGDLSTATYAIIYEWLVAHQGDGWTQFPNNSKTFGDYVSRFRKANKLPPHRQRAKPDGKGAVKYQSDI